MNFNSKVYAFSGLIIAALLIILGIGYFAAKHAEIPAVTPASSEATTTSIQGGGYTIEQIPLSQSTMPDLDHQITFDASVPSDVRTILQNDVTETAARLKKDPTNAADWFNLGIYYHEADDFNAAAQVWVFLTKVVAPPGNAVALENLGKLYALDLKDFPKAESYFNQAIAADSSTIDPYMELYQLYLYSYKQNTSAAVDTLNRAAAAFPSDYSAYLVLGGYYSDKGDTADARIALNKAMDRARAAGDVNAMASIGAQLAKLPQ